MSTTTSALFALATVGLGGTCTGPAPCPTAAAPWSEADALFRRDPRWRGGDVASTVDLGDDRILWLFGDSFVGVGGPRRDTRMVRNTIALQRGRDPSSGSFEPAWQLATDGRPASFFTEDGDIWHWPMGGVRTDAGALIFAVDVRSAEGGLGFAVADWSAYRIVTTGDAPAAWTATRVAEPAGDDPVAVGAASVWSGDHLYAFAPDEDGGGHAVYLARWPRADVIAGDLGHPTWWDGASFVEEATHRRAVVESVQTELSVHREGDQWIMVHTVGFGSTTIGRRVAPALTGPWSEPCVIYTPPESSDDGLLVYAGKAHPGLDAGGGLAITYVANAFSFERLLDDESVYYPRVMRSFRAGDQRRSRPQ